MQNDRARPGPEMWAPAPDAEPVFPWNFIDISPPPGYRLTERGVKIMMAETPIIPIYTYEPEITLRAQKALYERGVYVNATLPPACAPGGCLLRCSLRATHTTAQVDEAVDIIAAVLKELAL